MVLQVEDFIPQINADLFFFANLLFEISSNYEPTQVEQIPDQTPKGTRLSLQETTCF